MRKCEQRVQRLESLINTYGIYKVARVMNLSEEHINRNLLSGKSLINLVKLIAAENKLNKS